MQSCAAQVQHNLRHAAGKEHLHGGKVARSVGQRVHKARHQAVDFSPVGNRGAIDTGHVSDGGNVQQKIR